MDPKFFRKYADIVEAAEKNTVRIDEGVMDSLKGMVSKLAPNFSSQEIEAMKAAAQSVIGKPSATAADFTLDNIKAIAQKLGVKGPSAPTAQQVAESMDEGVVDTLKNVGQVAGGMIGRAGQKVGGMATAAANKVSGVLGQTQVDPKSGKGTLGSVDAWHPQATLGEKLVSSAGILGGTAATIAGFFGGPAWLIIPGILALMFLSQVGGTKD